MFNLWTEMKFAFKEFWCLNQKEDEIVTEDFIHKNFYVLDARAQYSDGVYKIAEAWAKNILGRSPKTDEVQIQTHVRPGYVNIGLTLPNPGNVKRSDLETERVYMEG